MTWEEAMHLASIKRVHMLKMDIEGHEYDVLPNILHSPVQFHPEQIAFELHYRTIESGLRWRFKSSADMALLLLQLFFVGQYLVIDRRDNELCRHCSELLLWKYDKSTSSRKRDFRSSCVVEPFTPSSELWLPQRSCCAWFQDSSHRTFDNAQTALSKLQLASFQMWDNNTVVLADQIRADEESSTVSIEKACNQSSFQHICAAVDKHIKNSFSGLLFISTNDRTVDGILRRKTNMLTSINIHSSERYVQEQRAIFEQPSVNGGDHELDFVLSYSALHRTGFGHEGKPTGPFRDLEWVERFKCLLKKHGLLIFAEPISTSDCVVQRSHRVYGPKRLKHLHGLRLIDQFGELSRNCSRKIVVQVFRVMDERSTLT